MNFAWPLCLCLPLRQQPLTRCDSLMRSVDGHALPIDELKGTKPVESIDLSGKKGAIGVASGIIIGACVKENVVLKELKCAPPFPSTGALTAYDGPHLCHSTDVQPRGQPAWSGGLQGGRGCARQDPDHVAEVRQPHPSQRLNLAWTLCLCLYVLAFASAAFDADNCSPPLLTASTTTT